MALSSPESDQEQILIAAFARELCYPSGGNKLTPPVGFVVIYPQDLGDRSTLDLPRVYPVVRDKFDQWSMLCGKDFAISLPVKITGRETDRGQLTIIGQLPPGVRIPTVSFTEVANIGRQPCFFALGRAVERADIWSNINSRNEDRIYRAKITFIDAVRNSLTTRLQGVNPSVLLDGIRQTRAG